MVVRHRFFDVSGSIAHFNVVSMFKWRRLIQFLFDRQLFQTIFLRFSINWGFAICIWSSGIGSLMSVYPWFLLTLPIGPGDDVWCNFCLAGNIFSTYIFEVFKILGFWHFQIVVMHQFFCVIGSIAWFTVASRFHWQHLVRFWVGRPCFSRQGLVVFKI